mmetsp:Transcript_14709/g.55683  ORF Transcript_14709/g.55683 Transcript_14709/m.55683 type:complete len:170 (+) Transcript_14709:755-1264(+)
MRKKPRSRRTAGHRRQQATTCSLICTGNEHKGVRRSNRRPRLTPSTQKRTTWRCLMMSSGRREGANRSTRDTSRRMESSPQGRREGYVPLQPRTKRAPYLLPFPCQGSERDRVRRMNLERSIAKKIGQSEAKRLSGAATAAKEKKEKDAADARLVGRKQGKKKRGSKRR